MKSLILIATVFLWGISCSEDQGRKSHGGEIIQTPEEPKSSNANPAMSLEQCNSQGKAWRPVVNGGANPSDCNGGTLKAWNNNCCKGMVVARYQSLASKAPELLNVLQGHLDNKFTMHACSERTDGKEGAIIHFYKVEGNKTFYEYVDISSREVDAKYECPSLPQSSISNETVEGVVDDAKTDSAEEEKKTAEDSKSDEEALIDVINELNK